MAILDREVYMSVALITTVFIVYHVIKHFREYGFNRKPFHYPFFGCVFEVVSNKDRFLDWATDSVREAPSNTFKLMVRAGEVYIHTAYPPNIEHVLKNKFDIYIKGKALQEGLTELLGGGIFNTDDGMWKFQRKIASFEFTTRSLGDYLMEALDTETRTRLVPTVESFVAKQVDLQDLLMRFAFDSICKLAFGVDPSALDPSLPHGKFMNAFDAATTLSNERYYVLHPLIWKTQRLLNIGQERKLQEAIQAVREFADSVIQTRKSTLDEQEHLDLLSRFMRFNALSDEDIERIEKFYSCKVYERRFPDRFLRDVVINFMLAGRDTTSSALSWFFWLLSTHPDVENKIVSEILKVKRSDKFSIAELKEMHYLHSALIETLRLYPPVPLDPKIAIADDVLPDGTKVRKGDKVTYLAYAMGRMEKLWGKDCMEFRPERWLKDGEFVGENVYKFPVFHAGPRICLGRDMAMLQMKYVVASLLSRFSFVLPTDYQPNQKINITLQIHGGLPATVCKRTYGA